MIKRGLLAWLSGLLLSTGMATAQDVHWRTDYQQARREAQEQNRPLLLDFGTENCLWCKKLDSTTFRVPAIVAALNGRFIPLKIDATKEAVLTQALQVQNFPTLVLAAPDGRILDLLEGFQEAGPLMERLQRILAAVGDPAWMTRDYQEAVKAIATSDYARAIALLKTVTEDGQQRPIQLKARQLLQDLEHQAGDRLARAQHLDAQGQTAEALTTLADLQRFFAGTPAAVEGGRLLASLTSRTKVKTIARPQQARELLAQAREDYRNGQYACCLDRCETLSADFADLPESGEAQQLTNEIKANPEWLQSACDQMTHRLGSLYLSLADTRLAKGQLHEAALALERVVQIAPGTRQAHAAQLRLATLQERAAWKTEPKKP